MTMVLNDLQDQQEQNDVFDPSLLGNKQHQLFYLRLLIVSSSNIDIFFEITKFSENTFEIYISFFNNRMVGRS